MRTLLALVATAVVAWWLGRDYEWRNGECVCQDEDGDMAVVRPSEPWPPNFTTHVVGDREYRRYDIKSGVTYTLPPETVGIDPTYADAYTHAVIRNTAQSSDHPTGGMC
jgi:hypothetical protein